MKRLEKKKNKENKSKKETNQIWNGVRVFRAVERLQKRNPGEKISFQAIYEEVNKKYEMHEDTVKRKLYRWFYSDLLKSIRGELRVYDKNGNRFDETNMKKTIGDYFQFQLVEKDTADADFNIEEVIKEVPRKSSKKVKTRKKQTWKTEVGEYIELIAKVLKEHKGYIGNGVELGKIVNKIIRQYSYIDSENISDISNKTILRKVWSMLNYHNMEACDLLGIRIGIASGKMLEEGQEVEFRVAQFNPDIVSNDPLPYEDKYDENADIDETNITEMMLWAFPTSEIWGELEQNWYWEEALAYKDFIININEKSAKWAISYEILKVLSDSQEKEGMKKIEIVQKLEEYIPSTYRERAEYEQELKEAFQFIEINELAQSSYGRWMLVEKI